MTIEKRVPTSLYSSLNFWSKFDLFCWMNPMTFYKCSHWNLQTCVKNHIKIFAPINIYILVYVWIYIYIKIFVYVLKSISRYLHLSKFVYVWILDIYLSVSSIRMIKSIFGLISYLDIVVHDMLRLIHNTYLSKEKHFHHNKYIIQNCDIQSWTTQ